MGHFKCQVTGIDVFPTSDFREREHFCLISFEKCGERGYFIHGEVQDEVVNVLFASNFRRRPSNSAGGPVYCLIRDASVKWYATTFRPFALIGRRPIGLRLYRGRVCKVHA